MLCYNGHLPNVSVATNFIHFSSTATSSATGEYVTVPERPSRNEEPISRTEEHTRNVPIYHLVLPENLLSELVWLLPVLGNEKLSYLAQFFFFTVTN